MSTNRATKIEIFLSLKHFSSKNNIYWMLYRWRLRRKRAGRDLIGSWWAARTWIWRCLWSEWLRHRWWCRLQPTTIITQSV